jgi:hypothetical protein
MHYKYRNRLYTREELEGKTFHEESKPEPVFTLEEMKNSYDIGFLDGAEQHTYNLREYFKQEFNIIV